MALAHSPSAHATGVRSERNLSLDLATTIAETALATSAATASTSPSLCSPGGEKDEACAKAGIDAVADQLG